MVSFLKIMTSETISCNAVCMPPSMFLNEARNRLN